MSFAQDKFSTVISLNAYRNGRNEPRPVAQVEAYWHALYSCGGIPERADIDPRGIDSALPHAFVVERVAQGVVRLRVAGRALCDLMGMELRGMPLGALFAPSCREDLDALMPTIFDRPALCHLELSAKGRLVQRAMRARMIMLPLRGHTGAITHALGAIEMVQHTGQSMKTPRRFDQMTTRLRSVSAQKASPLQSAHADIRRGFSDPASQFGPSPSKRHLRLVDNES